MRTLGKKGENFLQVKISSYKILFTYEYTHPLGYQFHIIQCYSTASE